VLPNHNAGRLAIGPDNYLYAIIGELRHNDKLQNIKDGPDPDDTGVIFRVNPADSSPTAVYQQSFSMRRCNVLCMYVFSLHRMDNSSGKQNPILS